MSREYALYDTTLRDGAQCEDMQLTTPDKVKIALRLDELGMDYIEGGWPGANPVDSEFFREVVSYRLKTAKISAFGSTHHPSHTAENDPTLMALLGLRRTGSDHFRQVQRTSCPRRSASGAFQKSGYYPGFRGISAFPGGRSLL